MLRNLKFFVIAVIILIGGYFFYNVPESFKNIVKNISTEKQLATVSSGNILKVGPGELYKKPSEAYEVAQDGDTIEIAAGEYVNDPICVRKNNLTFRGIGGYAHFKSVVLPGKEYPPNAQGLGCGGKGIWVVKSNNTTAENIEFSGAKVADSNGAGIRLEGIGLTVRNSYFHNNEMGILAVGVKDGDILVENSEFSFNGLRKGPAHNIYIGPIKTFTLKNSYSHDSNVGHLVKTRARTNYIIGNRLSGENGTGSYDIDISGGRAYVIGNIITKSANAENWGTSINFYTSRDPIGPHELYLVNNTMVINNLIKKGQFIRVASDPSIPTFAKAVNNIFVGVPGYKEISAPNMIMENNLRFNTLESAPFVNIAEYNYQLTADAEAINAGVNPGSVNGISLMPTTQYVHKSSGETRQISGPEIDIGAYEFTGTPTRLYPPPNVNFSVSQSTTDTSSNIIWSSNADSCVASGAWSGSKSTSGSFNTGPISEDTLYTLTCAGKGGTKSQSVTVKTPPNVAIVFTKTSKEASLPKGTGTFLSWTVTNAASCTSSGAWSGPLALSGVYDTKALFESKTYDITCTGLSGTIAKKSLTLTIGAPTTIPTVNPVLILNGNQNELSSIADGAKVIPQTGPHGVLHINKKDKTSSGIVEFLPTPGGQGVHFGPGGQQAKASAFYKFSLPSDQMKTLFKEDGGEVRATLVSRWNAKERAVAIPSQTGGHRSQNIFSATDGTTNIVTGLSVDMWGKDLIFKAQAPGADNEIIYYLRPTELIDLLFGKDITIRVRLVWDGSVQRLYLNDNLVVSGGYTKRPITWSTGSMFVIGAVTNLNYGPGFRALIDLLEDFTLSASDGSGSTKADLPTSPEQPLPPPKPAIDVSNTSPLTNNTENETPTPVVENGPDATDGIQPSNTSSNTSSTSDIATSNSAEDRGSSSSVTSFTPTTNSNNSTNSGVPSSSSNPTPVPTTVPTTVHSFTRPLSRGSVGEDVRNLQKFLNAEGFFVTNKGEETTLFGPKTIEALIRYQEKYRDRILTPNGLNAGTGILGPATIQFIRSLNKQYSPSSENTPISSQEPAAVYTRSLYYGVRGNDVSSLQLYLIAKGYLESGNDTGFYGTLTLAAIKNFQCSQKIICSGDEISTGWGVVGPKTRNLVR